MSFAGTKRGAQMKKTRLRKWLRWENLRKVPVILLGVTAWSSGGASFARTIREETQPVGSEGGYTQTFSGTPRTVEGELLDPLEAELQRHGTALGMASQHGDLSNNEWHRGNRHG